MLPLPDVQVLADKPRSSTDAPNRWTETRRRKSDGSHAELSGEVRPTRPPPHTSAPRLPPRWRAACVLSDAERAGMTRHLTGKQQETTNKRD